MILPAPVACPTSTYSKTVPSISSVDLLQRNLHKIQRKHRLDMFMFIRDVHSTTELVFTFAVLRTTWYPCSQFSHGPVSDYLVIICQFFRKMFLCTAGRHLVSKCTRANVAHIRTMKTAVNSCYAGGAHQWLGGRPAEPGNEVMFVGNVCFDPKRY